jgi:hypothetical protein
MVKNELCFVIEKIKLNFLNFSTKTSYGNIIATID